MAKAIDTGSAVRDYTDPYGDFLKDPAELAYSAGSIIAGGVYPSSCWPEQTKTMPNRTDIVFPENSQVFIGPDLVMSTKEFATCMKLLQKIAMKEIPEDFI